MIDLLLIYYDRYKFEANIFTLLQKYFSFNKILNYLPLVIEDNVTLGQHKCRSCNICRYKPRNA